MYISFGMLISCYFIYHAIENEKQENGQVGFIYGIMTFAIAYLIYSLAG